MFGKRETAKFDPSEFRVHDRHSVNGLKAYVDGQEVEILDYSDGGLRAKSLNPLPRVATIEIFKGEKSIRTTVAVTAWTRGDQTGYAFRSKLKVTNIEPVQRKAIEKAEAVTNATGGFSGNALRDRLKL